MMRGWHPAVGRQRGMGIACVLAALTGKSPGYQATRVMRVPCLQGMQARISVLSSHSSALARHTCHHGQHRGAGRSVQEGARLAASACRWKPP